MEALRSRIEHWSIVLAPAWRYCFALPTIVLGSVAFWRDEILPPEVAAKWKILSVIPAWPWYVWAIGTLIIVIGLVLEGSFRLSRRVALQSSSADASTRALEAHAEELRLTRLAREKENDPIERVLKAALDPTRRSDGIATAKETPKEIPRLKITVEPDAKIKAVAIYRSTRTFSISVENPSRSDFVSNCKLYLDIINPKTGSPARHLIQNSFTLNPTESRSVEIVHYAEPTGSTRGDHENDRIILHLPPPGGWASNDMWPWFLPLGAYVITLTVLSREAEPCESVCKIWVDDSYKLHFERA